MEVAKNSLRALIQSAGGQTKLARRLSTEHKKCSQSKVWNWLNRNGRVPAAWVLRVHECYPDFSLHSLRPDLYPPGPKLRTAEKQNDQQISLLPE